MKRDFSLKGKTLFQEVFKRGHKLQEHSFQVFVLKKEDIYTGKERVSQLNDGHIKIGITMNKRIGKAFIRNRIKRRIKSICSELIPQCKHNYCVIIKPDKNSIHLSYTEQKEIIRLLFNKAEIIG